MSPVIKKGRVSKVEYLFGEPADELISGSETGLGSYTAVLKTPGDYKRGELMMISSNGKEFVKATSEGVTSAKVLGILADDIFVPEDLEEEDYTEITIYSSGRFKAKSVIIPYETEENSHEELIESLRPVLLPMKIYID